MAAGRRIAWLSLAASVVSLRAALFLLAIILVIDAPRENSGILFGWITNKFPDSQIIAGDGIEKIPFPGIACAQSLSVYDPRSAF